MTLGRAERPESGWTLWMVSGVLPVEPNAAKGVEEVRLRWDFQLRSARSMVEMKEDGGGPSSAAPVSKLKRSDWRASRAVPFEDRATM